MNKTFYKLFFILLGIILFSGIANSTDRLVGPGKPYTTIQSAIDAADPGDLIKVYPGNYNESAPNSIFNGYPYQFGLFFSASKTNITVEGCKTDGTPVTNTADIAAFIVTNATNTFGYAGTFVVGNNITLRGLEFGSNSPADDKAIEVLGNGFVIDACRITADAPIYIGDYNYNESGTPSDFSDDISSIQSYTISNCHFALGDVYIANGAGWTGATPGSVAGRSITGCTFEGWAIISFAGFTPGTGWLNYPTGAATITGNTFINTDPGNTRYIQSWGVVQAQFPYASYWNNNTFPKKTLTTTDGNPDNVRAYDVGSFFNLKRIGNVIQARITNALAGDVILVGAGTYNEAVDMNKVVTLNGSGSGVSGTVITNSGGTAVNMSAGTDALNRVILSNVRLTGSSTGIVASSYNKLENVVSISNSVYGIALNNLTDLLITNCKFNSNTSGGMKIGSEVSASLINISGSEFNGNTYGWYGDASSTTEPTFSNITVTNTTFNDNLNKGIYLERLSNAVFTNITVNNCGTGGPVNHRAGIDLNLKWRTDYTNIQIINSTISNCGKDDPNGGGILIKARNDGGTYGSNPALLDNLTLTGCTILNNGGTGSYSTGIRIGEANNALFGVNPSPTNVVMHNLSFSGNSVYNLRNATTDVSAINAENNWWGSGDSSVFSSKISGNVDWDPWIGKSQTQPIVINTPIIFSSANTTVAFTTLPPGVVGDLTVQLLSAPPSGYPAPPASAGPAVVYLNITAPGLINYTFSATVVLDVSTIPGFVPGTEVMFYSTVSNSWVGINGTYDAMAQTYTFVTDHFTPFAYVNPANPDGLYISQSITSPQMNQRWYPQVGMGNPSSYGANDWTYVNDTARFYMIPAGTQGIYAAKFMVTWDKSKANLTVANGNLWGSNMFYQAIDSSSGNNGKYWFNISSNDLTNAVPDTTGGKYLAVLKFAITKPGYIPVSIIGTDFRYYHASGDSTSGVYVTTNPGAMVFYLGDFESPSSQNIGDGKINATDISNFSTAYWSLNTNPLYRAKYDVGPTNTSGSYFAMPTPDNKIEFEDLVIFSIGYGKTGAGQLNRIKSEEPVVVSAGTMTMGEDGLYRLPVNLNGPVYDVRALSIGLNYNSSTLEYAGVEKQGELTTNTSFLIGKAEGNKIYMDASLVGTDNGISTEGTTANILFREKSAGNHDVTINSVILRNSYNEEIEARFGTEAGSLIPKTFGLSQNYPNPFNPATTIKYQIPATVKVTIRVYDLLGREVVTLVNGVQEAGYYSAEWNAQNYASGVYFYKMIAGDFENVKKLVLVK